MSYQNRCEILIILCIFFLVKIVVSQDDSDETIDPPRNLTNQNIPSLQLIKYGRKSYYLGNVFKGNFFQSEQFCRYHGMNLVSITSKDENDFLLKKIEQGNPTERFWSSGTKLPDSSRWVWFTLGTPLTYKNWDKENPSSDKDDECIGMYIKNSQLKWFNKDCWHDFFFICEVTWRDCVKEKDIQNIRDIIDVRSGV